VAQTQLGPSEMTREDSKLRRDKNEAPSFPPELFLAVAKYFKPGTKTMAEFAMMSKDTYALLLTPLLEVLDLSRFNVEFDMHETKLEFAKAALKSLLLDHLQLDRLGRVRRLELQAFLMLPGAQELLRRCTNLRQASIRYRVFTDETIFVHPTLEVLEFRDHFEFIRRYYKQIKHLPVINLPNLTHLVATGNLGTRFLDAFVDCPALKAITLSFNESNPYDAEYRTINRPVTFPLLAPATLGKIKTFIFKNERCEKWFDETRAQSDELKPTDIVVKSGVDLATVFAKLRDMRSIERLHLDKIDTSNLMSLIDSFPPNLKLLEIGRLDLMLPRDRFEALRRWCAGWDFDVKIGAVEAYEEELDQILRDWQDDSLIWTRALDQPLDACERRGKYDAMDDDDEFYEYY
jgi:hypothetical protein